MNTQVTYEDRKERRLYRRTTTNRLLYNFIETGEDIIPRNPIVQEMIDFFTTGKYPSDYVKKFINDAYNDSIDAESYSAIGVFGDDYVIAFNDAPNLLLCAARLTYTDEDVKRFNGFMMQQGEKKTRIFFNTMYHYCREHQRINIIKGLPVDGVLYGVFPQEDLIITKDDFIYYPDISSAARVMNFRACKVVNEAIEKGCTYEEICAVLPTDIRARFLSRKFTDLELATIECLTPGIAEQA